MRRFLPYILILIVLVGLFSPMIKLDAQTNPLGQCKAGNGDYMGHVTQAECKSNATSMSIDTQWDVVWTPDDTTQTAVVVRAGTAQSGKTETPKGPQSDFEKEIGKNLCGFGVTGFGGTASSIYPGCFIQISYGLFYVIPALLLWASAYFFNVLISITLTGNLLAGSEFIPGAWAVVRDLSNIFFILILLYIAIKLILGLTGHDVKKMIVRVVIVALLINFSMFFTQIVIDSSNILALIFYNKLEVQTKNSDGTIRNYDPVTGEKDVAGSMVNAFNPTSLLTAEFFAKTKVVTAYGQTFANTNTPVAPGILIGITIIAGLLMFFATFCFFMAGLSFVARLIELWVLIIFSPFAFMSSTVPKLASVDYLGWDSWLKRLLKTAFMAPIFMFFMYFIFLLIQKGNPFGNIVTKNNSVINTLLLIVIPTLVILVLLLKATEFAKKGSGVLGEKLMTGAKVVGGLALGAATGGTALVGTALIGGGAARVANSDELRRKAAEGNRGAQMTLAGANYFANKSFDVRQTGLGKFAAKKTGMDFNKGTGALGLDTEKFKGGRKAQITHKGEEEQKRQKTYEMSADAAVRQTELARVQNARVIQYEKDKELARAFAKEKGFEFKEKDFKEDYVAGKNLNQHGLDKTVAPGSVEKENTAAEINADRRKAYANSLDDKAKEAAKNAVGTFFAEWVKGAGKMMATPAGAATTLAAGAITGGIGASIVIAGGGFLHALRGALNVKATNAEVRAAVRKGEDSNKWLKDELKKISKGEHVDHEKVTKKVVEVTSGGDKKTETGGEVHH